MSSFWQIITARAKKTFGESESNVRQPLRAIQEFPAARPNDLLIRLRQFLVTPGESDSHLYPKWLATQLETTESELLDALAYAIGDGLVELHWEVYCPVCGRIPAEFVSLKESRGNIDCPACGANFDVHLDRDVRVTFSATERVRRTRGEISVLIAPERDAPENNVPTRGLDLLLVPSFRKLFRDEAPPLDESLRITRVAILFTDLLGSTTIYAERGDPRAYRMVRDHFGILTKAVERNRGVLVKTIGDSVMASFAAGADAVRAGLEAQAELRNRVAEIGGELVLKAGVHAGACLAVNLNERLDFFGEAVNIAARVQGLARGNDVVVTDAVFAEVSTSAIRFRTIEDFDSKLRGVPAPVRVRRLTAN